MQCRDGSAEARGNARKRATVKERPRFKRSAQKVIGVRLMREEARHAWEAMGTIPDLGPEIVRVKRCIPHCA